MADGFEVIRAAQDERAKSLRSSYDYVVCGSGSAGCVIASRLAANSAINILLIESGGWDTAPQVLDPGQWFTNLGTERDWGDVAIPGPGSTVVRVPALLEAARELGHPVLPDQNGAREESAGGFALMNQIIRDGQRHNMAKAFLYPVLAQGNITVLTQAYVNRVVLQGGRATGVEVKVGGQNVVIGATSEVILNAAVSTPRRF